MNFDELIAKEYSRPDTGRMQLDAPSTNSHDLETILNVIRKINTSLVLSDVLELVTDEAIRLAKGERGFLMLADRAGHLEFVVGRNAQGESIEAESFQISSSVLEDVFSTGESVCIENALNDERFERRQSILNLELQTIVCSSLHTHDEKIGVIYVDSKYIQAIDKADILRLFEILAGQSAIAIKNARLFEDLRQTYERLKQANTDIVKFERMASKGELAAEVSHELKNLIAVVLLNLELLQMKAGKISAEEIKEMIERTVKGAKKIELFSSSLLSRSAASAQLLPGSLNKLAVDFVDFVKVLPKFRRNTIKVCLEQDLPTIDLDTDEVQQVLLNLVNNSVEACPEAKLEVITERTPGGDHVLLKVRDNGPGLDEAIASRLFNERITTKVDGHGYGLPICKQIMEHHGGCIRVDSVKGAGATFVLTFPVRRS